MLKYYCIVQGKIDSGKSIHRMVRKIIINNFGSIKSVRIDA